MLRNTPTSWGAVSRLFHWAGAALIAFMLAHGFWMAEFAPRDARFANYSWHASTGYALLVLMIARLAWRWSNAVPALPQRTSAWEAFAAHAGHWALYLLILASSLTGWALAGSGRRPLDAKLFGLIAVPPIVPGPDRALHDRLEDVHSVLAWVLLALVVVHVGAAFFHLLVRRDGVMERMLSPRARG
jgi:cytochrome b561